MPLQNLQEILSKESHSSPANGNGRYLVVADDNPADRRLMKTALEENQVHEESRFVVNGLELLKMLEQCKPTRIYEGTPCHP